MNIPPKNVATELKEKGFSEPVIFEYVSVMFTDFKGFTQIAEKLSPSELLKDLDACIVQFDKITERYNLENLNELRINHINLLRIVESIELFHSTYLSSLSIAKIIH